MGRLNNLWLATVAAAFWGPILALASCPHLYAFRVLFVVHFLALAITLSLAQQRTAYFQEIKVQSQLKCFLLWLTWAVVSCFWADNKLAAARHIWALLSGISIITFTVFYLNSTVRLIKYGALCTATLLIFIGIGFWESQTGQHLKQLAIIDPIIYAKEFFIPTAVFTNRNDFATFLSLFLPFLYAWTRHAPWWTKPLIWPFVLLGVYLINVTTSRANILALLLMLVTAVLLYLLDIRKKGWKYILVVSVILAAVFCGLTYYGWQSGQLQKLAYQITSLQSETDIRGGSIQVRMGLIQGGLAMLQDHYWLGVGAGNVEHHMQAYWLQTRGLQNLHNWWVEVLVNYGLLIWGLYLYCYAELLWGLGLVFRKTGNVWLKRFAEALLLSLVGFVIGCTSSSTLYAANYMWILYGVGLAVYNRYLCEAQDAEAVNSGST